MNGGLPLFFHSYWIWIYGMVALVFMTLNCKFSENQTIQFLQITIHSTFFYYSLADLIFVLSMCFQEDMNKRNWINCVRLLTVPAMHRFNGRPKITKVRFILVITSDRYVNKKLVSRWLLMKSKLQKAGSWLTPSHAEWTVVFCGSADSIGTAERKDPMLHRDTPHTMNPQRVCINATKLQRYDVNKCASRGVYLMDNIIFFFYKYHTKNHMDIPKSIGTCVMLLWTISFDLFREKWKLIKRKKKSVPKVNDQQHTFNTLFPTACTYFVFF